MGFDRCRGFANGCVRSFKMCSFTNFLKTHITFLLKKNFDFFYSHLFKYFQKYQVPRNKITMHKYFNFWLNLSTVLNRYSSCHLSNRNQPSYSICQSQTSQSSNSCVCMCHNGFINVITTMMITNFIYKRTYCFSSIILFLCSAQHVYNSISVAFVWLKSSE